MTLRTARVLAGSFFALELVSVTWPGLVPFARIRPMVFGLPFSLAWIAAWISGSVIVLFLLDRVERRHRRPDTGRGVEPPPAGSHPSGSSAASGGGDI